MEPPPLNQTTKAPSSPGVNNLSGDAFEPLSRPVRFALTLGPAGGFGLIMLLTAALVNPGAAGFVAGMALGAFVGAGKLVILAGALEQAPVGPWALAALIVYMDLAEALIMLGGMHYLYLLPGAGQRMASARETGWRLLQRNPWMYRATWLVLAGFVAVPFHGTGAMVGAVLGRLMGLSRLSIVAAVGFGSLVGSSALALIGDFWEERITALGARPLSSVAVVLVVAAIAVLGSRWVLVRSDERGAADGEG